jgi:hypothetical protein
MKNFTNLFKQTVSRIMDSIHCLLYAFSPVNFRPRTVNLPTNTIIFKKATIEDRFLPLWFVTNLHSALRLLMSSATNAPSEKMGALFPLSEFRNTSHSRSRHAFHLMGRCFAVLGLLLALAGSSALTGQIALDGVSSTTNSSGAATITLNHTTGAGSNRLMLVGISIEQDGAGTAVVNSVTYGTGMTQQNLTQLVSEGPNGEAESQIWYLIAPQTGTFQITVNISSFGVDDAFVVGVQTFTGVHQSTPLGSPATSSDGTSPSSISVSGVLANELVFGVIAHDDARPITSDAAQTALWDVTIDQGGADGITGGAATKSGTGNVQLSWTLDDENDGTAMVAVAIKPIVCALSSATLASITCNDNSTNSNAADDYITFTLDPIGTALGATYSVSVNNGGTVTMFPSGLPATGVSYGAPVAFRLQNGSANGSSTYILTIEDDGGSTCNVTANISPAVASCSNCPAQPFGGGITVIKN